ncbi:MAG: hypothetical protein HYX78_02755 [Armatimonadetes bacterium]|nr:hypothetical protein [Armatimonadota bacterium]
MFIKRICRCPAFGRKAVAPWLAMLAIAACVAFGSSAATAKKEFEADKGPKTVDVSKYPKPYQERYKVFSKKCGKCHTLARPVNSDFVPSKWQKYVKRMRRKPDSAIRSEDAENIWQFLIFDTRERKKSFWDKLPKDEKDLAEQGFKKVAEEG